MSSEIKMKMADGQAPLSEDFIIEEGHEMEELEENEDDGYESRQSAQETEQIIEEIVEGINLKRRGTLIRTICSIIRY